MAYIFLSVCIFRDNDGRCFQVVPLDIWSNLQVVHILEYKRPSISAMLPYPQNFWREIPSKQSFVASSTSSSRSIEPSTKLLTHEPLTLSMNVRMWTSVETPFCNLLIHCKPRNITAFQMMKKYWIKDAL